MVSCMLVLSQCCLLQLVVTRQIPTGTEIDGIAKSKPQYRFHCNQRELTQYFGNTDIRQVAGTV